MITRGLSVTEKQEMCVKGTEKVFTHTRTKVLIDMETHIREISGKYKNRSFDISRY